MEFARSSLVVRIKNTSRGSTGDGGVVVDINVGGHETLFGRRNKAGAFVDSDLELELMSPLVPPDNTCNSHIPIMPLLPLSPS